jgi:hypothetical protein
MKGIRHTTEEKIRILRETFHRRESLNDDN